MRGAVSDDRPYRDPNARKSAIRAYKFRENARKKLVGEGKEPSPSIFFSSLLENVITDKGVDSGTSPSNRVDLAEAPTCRSPLGH